MSTLRADLGESLERPNKEQTGKELGAKQRNRRTDGLEIGRGRRFLVTLNLTGGTSSGGLHGGRLEVSPRNFRGLSCESRQEV
mmetsp:Transcript_14170/g.18425  ORF Transcript_14170/g.18425 Transcript_14170/m.18425 type:complete len:83 (+) Transcript_14170:476-724(+)